MDLKDAIEEILDKIQRLDSDVQEVASEVYDARSMMQDSGRLRDMPPLSGLVVEMDDVLDRLSLIERRLDDLEKATNQ